MKKAAAFLAILLTGCGTEPAAVERTATCPERSPSWPVKERGENAEPAWSPDGRSLAFQSNRTGAYQIHILEVDDCSVRQLTRIETSPDPPDAPDWSPDGREIVFSRLDRGLWSIRSDGTGLRQIVDGDASWPAWSPDGRTIVFTRGYPNNLLVAVPPPGGKERVLGPGAGAAWSPDGRRLAFVGNDDATWIMLADGTRKQRVTTGAGNGDQDVAWSPDGRRLVIAHSTVDSGLTLFVKTLGGGLERVRGAGNAWAPDWSPDGQAIAYTRALDGDDLFLIPVRGGDPRRLTVSPGSSG
jgi:Tol biopolymer transport system component